MFSIVDLGIFTWLLYSIAIKIYVQSLKCHSCLHIGHNCCSCWEFNHFKIQCIWKTCVHLPQTKGQSSPGILQSGQQPSNCIRQIPQFSSFAVQCQVATAVHFFIFTFISGCDKKLTLHSPVKRQKETCLFLGTSRQWCWTHEPK